MATRPTDVTRPLTPFERRFTIEYPVDHNGTDAAIRAGYSPKRAAVTASELLKRDDIRKIIDVTERKIVTLVERTAADISRAAWAIIENEDIPASARVSALTLEAKRHREYSEKHEVSGDIHHRIEALQVMAQMSPEDVKAMAERARLR